MKDLTVVLSNYKMRIVDPPAPKMRQLDGGAQVPVVDRQGVTQFVVSIFAKLQVQAGALAPKGEELKVTLETDPGQGFEEGMVVELINPRVSPYEIRTDDGRVISGLSFKAMGLTPVAPARAEK